MKRVTAIILLVAGLSSCHHTPPVPGWVQVSCYLQDSIPTYYGENDWVCVNALGEVSPA